MTEQPVTRTVAAVQLLLVLPAALFLAAVLARSVPAVHDGAQSIVMLYAGKVWTLWLLLLLLPLCVLASGCAMLLRERRLRHDLSAAGPHGATLSRQAVTRLVTATTALSAGILVTVVLHMLAN